MELRRDTIRYVSPLSELTVSGENPVTAECALLTEYRRILLAVMFVVPVGIP